MMRAVYHLHRGRIIGTQLSPLTFNELKQSSSLSSSARNGNHIPTTTSTRLEVPTAAVEIATTRQQQHHETTDTTKTNPKIPLPLSPSSLQNTLPYTYDGISNYSHFTPQSSNTDNNDSSIWDYLFSLQLPEGRCVGLRLNSSNLSSSAQWYQKRADNSNEKNRKRNTSGLLSLHPEEIAYGLSLPEAGEAAARTAFFVGRLAIRFALTAAMHNQLHLSHEWRQEILDTIRKTPILKDEHGRPTMPHGYLGSISHKRNTGVALVHVDHKDWENNKDRQGQGPTRGIGVDIEQTLSRRHNVAKRVLTKRELNDLGKIEGVTTDEEVLLRFSLKESVYKAMHPLICQFVGFQEAEVTPHANGTATIWLNIKNGADEILDHSLTTAHWQRIPGGYFLTSASVTKKKIS